MIILGIDPGFNRLGFALLENNQSVLNILDSGFIETESGKDYQERILEIGIAVQDIIKKHKPDILAIEKLFFTTNQKTALKVSEIKGVVMYLCAFQKIPCVEYTPLQIKSAVCGYGKADKKQIRDMLKLSFKNYVLPKNDDACDAIAVAYTSFLLLRNNLRMSDIQMDVGHP